MILLENKSIVGTLKRVLGKIKSRLELVFKMLIQQ